jgi:glycosyltransferase involved in cell wall biosynthesis
VTPVITIIIPTFRRASTLERALVSVHREDRREIEILVVDDDAEMSGVSVVQKFSNVRYFAKRGVDRGLSFSRNIGIDMARGEFLIFLDDDDYLFDGATDTFMCAISPRMNFYYGNAIYRRKAGDTRVSLEALNFEDLKVVNRIPVGSYMIRRSAIKSKFDTSMKSHEDWCFLLSNLDRDSSIHLNVDIALIDKSIENLESMQKRREQYFWMEFVGIYAKFPAPDLAAKRQLMLQNLGISIPLNLLQLDDTY